MDHSRINNVYIKIRKLIIEGETKLAIEELDTLIEYCGDESLEDELLLLSSRYHRYDKKCRQGIIDDENQLEFNKIDSSLIGLLKEAKRLVLEKSSGPAIKMESSSEPLETESYSVIREKQFEALISLENNGNIQRYRLRKDGQDLEYREVLGLWESDEDFLDFYISLFKKCGFNSYTWETPAVSTDTITRDFEFVILNTPMPSKTPDYDTYREYFDINNSNAGVVSFLNLGHDAILVVPSPFRSKANYSSLCSFFQEAPIDQQKALWKVTASQAKIKMSASPIWLSVAGGGISWLHIRLDDKPKYYRYGEYIKPHLNG